MIERLFFQGVESERCPSFTAAMKAGKPVKIDVNQAMTLADGK
jgi:threonine dehydratase